MDNQNYTYLSVLIYQQLSVSPSISEHSSYTVLEGKKQNLDGKSKQD